MKYELELPKDKAQAEEVLTKLIADGENFRHLKEVNWWLCHYYLQGVRTFTNIDFRTGTLDVSFVDSEGLLSFRWDYIIKQMQAQQGRLSQIDLRPTVTRKSVGLDDLRKASVSQVALDSVVTQSMLDSLSKQMYPALLKYGKHGLFVNYRDDRIGLDVVMPWEIVPIPPNPVEEGELCGIARVRMVPLEWIKTLPGVPGPQDGIWKEIETTQVARGTQIKDTSEGMSSFRSMVSVPQGKGGSGDRKDKTTVEMCKFAEIYTTTWEGMWKEYVMTAGGRILKREDKSKMRMESPLQMVDDIQTGGFWNRSFVSTLLPVNTEMEWTIGRVFQNLQDTDAYGIVCIPTTLGMATATITRGADGIKRLMFEPDYMAAKELVPFTMTPANTGLAPMKGVDMGIGLSERMAAQPQQMMQGSAPGRVDSNQALGFLYEVSNVPMIPTARSISMAMSACYRVILKLLKDNWSKEKMVEVSNLDDSLAGVKLDTKTGMMSLTDNALPEPHEVEIGIRSMLPRSEEQEKLELVKSLEMRAIDMFEFRIQVRKKGLSIPVGNEPEWQNYRRAMLENIQLFGDGINPGSVIVSKIDLHEVHLRVLDAFMARPEFYAASPRVRDSFVKHREEHLSYFGSFPDQLPNPEESAMMAQQAAKQGFPQGGGVMPPAGGGEMSPQIMAMLQGAGGGEGQPVPTETEGY